MRFDCQFKVKHNFKKFNTINQRLPLVANEFTEEVLKNIRGYAIRLEKGHNQEGILIEMIDMSKKQVKGRVHTDKEKFAHAMFEHFGTGDYRELSAIGKTKRFIETGGSQWFIPVHKVEKVLHYPIIEIQGNQFYIAHGVKANHFMTDAEFESRNENADIVKNKINEMLKEVCK